MAQVGLRVVLLTYNEPLAPASNWCFLTIRAQSFWWLWGQPSSGESPTQALEETERQEGDGKPGKSRGGGAPLLGSAVSPHWSRLSWCSLYGPSFS